jgi:hypothetical protein
MIPDRVMQQVRDVLSEPAPAVDSYKFLQLVYPIAVLDRRSGEQTSDTRFTVGIPVCHDGDPVTLIAASGQWFDVTAGRVYRVPMTNVRSARR